MGLGAATMTFASQREKQRALNLLAGLMREVTNDAQYRIYDQRRQEILAAPIRSARLRCPFCDAWMKIVDGRGPVRYRCPGQGPLLTRESGPCPYAGEALTRQRIEQIAVALIDLDMDD